MAVTTETFVLTYDDTPKSLNDGGTGSRRHWSAGYKEKRQWQGIWGMLLIARKAPRGMTRAYVEVVLEFADNRRRDVENYRPSVSKPLADALVSGGWLADDTDEFFELGNVKLRSGVDLGESLGVHGYTKGRTVVTIEAEYDRAAA